MDEYPTNTGICFWQKRTKLVNFPAMMHFKIFIVSIYNTYYKDGKDKHFISSQPFAALVMCFTIATCSLYICFLKLCLHTRRDEIHGLVLIPLMYACLFYYHFFYRQKFTLWYEEVYHQFDPIAWKRYRIISWVILIIMFCSIAPASMIFNNQGLRDIRWR